jgi:Ni/Fe-hydrogenase subunit HybB-like protein
MNGKLVGSPGDFPRSEGMLRFLASELKPKGKLLTVFNVISIPVMLLGVGLLVIRFAYGLGSITNLSQDYPWGLWIGFDVVTGVAFAGGAYVVTFLVYIMRIEKYRPIVRITVLNGLLAYIFYAGALLLDLGRPWNVINPIIGNSFGLSSVLFLVAWHFLLYMIAQAIEFSPAVAEWIGLQRATRILKGMTLGTVIFGVTLSMLHQSGLGALYLMARDKVHPLWYSEFIPILFLVSSVFAGLSMVIFEGTISNRVFAHRLGAAHHRGNRPIVLGLARICAGTMFVYIFLQAIVFVHGNDASHLFSGMGAWFLLEMIGFVVIPCVMFVMAVRHGNMLLSRVAAVTTMLGVVLNRLNVTVIAFKWDAPVRYVPTWMEFAVTLAVIFAEIWVLRWIVNRMPVLDEKPDSADSPIIDGYPPFEETAPCQARR